MKTQLAAASLILLTAMSLGSPSLAQNLTAPAELVGRWEGSIVGDFRSQNVSWQFDLSENGELFGLMGPTEFGEPELQMENLVIADNSISFGIASQNAQYSGSLEDGRITGIWQQGFSHPLNMERQDFQFTAPATVRDILEGTWQTSISGSNVQIEFNSSETGEIAGSLSIPASDIEAKPFTSISIQADGYLELHTEVDRSFVGRLVNGHLLGTYQVRNTTYQASFLKPGQEDIPVLLNLPSTTRSRLLGSWTDRVGGTRVTMRFDQAENGSVQGFLTIGRRKAVPILEVESQDINVAITSANGRRIVGEISDGEITGDYNVNGGRSSSVTFVKEEQVIEN